MAQGRSRISSVPPRAGHRARLSLAFLGFVCKICSLMTEATKAKKKASPKASKASKQGSESSFAVIATGGKQYLVREGDTLRIEKLQGNHKEGDSIKFDSILMTGTGSDITLGKPFIKGGAVSGTLKGIGRNAKVTVIKYKQKSRYFKKYGHKQPYFEIKIDSIK